MIDWLQLKPEVVVDVACHTGEGPLWVAREACLYWVDIPRGHLYRHSPANGQTECFELGCAVGGTALESDGRLALFMAEGAVQLWRDGQLESLLQGLPEEVGNRFNDVIADPQGRVFAGVMSTPERPGRLYRLDDRGIAVVQEGIGTSNGLGFTPDRSGMYYTDTRRHEIYLFDYDGATGEIANRRVFVHVDEGASRPDGLTVDAEGCVWSARWEGSCLVRYDPSGVEMGRVTLPALKVSSVTFGGRDYMDMYVTTAGGDERSENGALAGAVFRLRPGVRGVPEFCSRMGTYLAPKGADRSTDKETA